MNEIREFKKYKSRGAYHWEQIGFHLLKRNIFVLGRYKNMLKLVKNEIGNLRDIKVLDIGCGDGVLSYLFAKEKADVSGLDYSDIAINFAKEKTKKYNIDFRQGSAYELPFKDNSFDVIISSDVIEHLEDVFLYLSEIKRVAKNDALIVISTPIKYTEYPLDKEHVIEWFPDEYREVIDRYMGKSKYYYSHPLALEDIYQLPILGKQWLRLFFNIYSFISNPFIGFKSKLKYKALQYSVSKVEK
jgi:2-polyprenyl-3-methyl-5-hydroxy-6-metoxy-1,4-benzoquinol methylase